MESKFTIICNSCGSRDCKVEFIYSEDPKTHETYAVGVVVACDDCGNHERVEE